MYYSCITVTHVGIDSFVQYLGFCEIDSSFAQFRVSMSDTQDVHNSTIRPLMGHTEIQRPSSGVCSMGLFPGLILIDNNNATPLKSWWQRLNFILPDSHTLFVGGGTHPEANGLRVTSSTFSIHEEIFSAKNS